MKSYTDLEQSKKLAEFLPLESADMIYIPIMDIDSMSNSGFLDIPECYPFNEFKNSNVKPLPCWSLVALLEEIPSITVNNVGEDLKLHIDKDDLQYFLFYENEYTGDMFEIETELYDNMIDACYEMIIKLHEQNLL